MSGRMVKPKKRQAGKGEAAKFPPSNQRRQLHLPRQSSLMGRQRSTTPEAEHISCFGRVDPFYPGAVLRDSGSERDISQ